jgi:hypothetical protein
MTQELKFYQEGQKISGYPQSKMAAAAILKNKIMSMMP